jgi:hypothetical protein
MQKIGKLSVIQYDAIMQAINNYKAQLEDGALIDYTGKTTYTGEQLRKAIEEVENIIIKANIPF